jgi:pimeloyl-ACP methyl ester carboxylesterase
MKKYLLPLFALALVISACAMKKSFTPLSSMQDIQYPFSVKKAQLSNDIEIAYADEGSGAPIIFVHGLGSYMPAWKLNIEQLKSDYRCIAIDLPGYGKSSKGGYPGNMTFYADVLIEFADKLGLDRFTLVGHSMGGQISIVTALANPERVEKLILAAPAGFETFTNGEKEWLRNAFSTRGVMLTPAETIRENFATNFFDMPKSARFMIEDRMAMRSTAEFKHYCYIITKNVSGMVDQPVFDKLKNISQPCLILFGEKDQLIPNRYLHGGKTEKIARQGAEQIPGSKLVMVPKAGHFVQFEQPSLFNQTVRDFLSK